MKIVFSYSFLSTSSSLSWHFYAPGARRRKNKTQGIIFFYIDSQLRRNRKAVVYMCQKEGGRDRETHSVKRDWIGGEKREAIRSNVICRSQKFENRKSHDTRTRLGNNSKEEMEFRNESSNKKKDECRQSLATNETHLIKRAPSLTNLVFASCVLFLVTCPRAAFTIYLDVHQK